ncbi:MAG TPA: hypothetical protein PLH71_08345 [Clostridia bacterium]|jgi:hypothetical protein|nr:hypothetical protein [Clostridia bacterium]
MKKINLSDMMSFEENILDEFTLDEKDMALLTLIEKEIESTLKNIRIFDLQTNKRMEEILSQEIYNQGERINQLMDNASPELKKYLEGYMTKIKDTYLN